MNIAFYAPMKPPTSPRPSGDRLIARQLIKALTMAGFDVNLASRFRSYDRTGDLHRQQRLMKLGEKLSARLIRRYRRMSDQNRPQIWLTYHLYHKAPDLLGPAVTAALNIPYVVIEASTAEKQRHGPWALGYQCARQAIKSADRILGLSRVDRGAILKIIDNPEHYLNVPPFIDLNRFSNRFQTGNIHTPPRLLTVAMMRSGDKLQSYHVLAGALQKITDLDWHIRLVGGGDAEQDVRLAMAPHGDRVTFSGVVAADEMAGIFAASDVLVWPGLKETPGMCFLEAAASGLPAIGADAYGVPDVIDDGKTGFLCRPGDVDDLAGALRQMLTNPGRLMQMGRCAREEAVKTHSLEAASRTLDRILGELR